VSSVAVGGMAAYGAELPMPRIAGQPPPVTRPSASRPERLGRPGLSRPPAGLHQWRTIADARCSAQWTGRGNRRSALARRSPRKCECRRQCLPARRRKFGGTRPAIGSRCHRAALCRKSSAPKSRPSASVSCFKVSRCARISCGGNGEAATAPTGCHPSPCRAVRRSAARECPPTQIGGYGFCTGKGSQRISVYR
jgi:hypothetical protein